MKYKNYYEVLGVPRTADQNEIKKAYRKLAHQYHPDISNDPAGEDKFKEIGEAYATLKDQEKRKAYDNLGTYSTGEEFEPNVNWAFNEKKSGQNHAFDNIDLADLFASFRSHAYQANQKHGPIAGQDYETSIHISLEDAYKGTTVELNFSVPEYNSEGYKNKVQHTLKVRIPKGVTDGQKMLLRGKGGSGANKGKNGNLYLNIHLLPHKLYKVHGHDLTMHLPITPWEAALGTSIKIPTLDSPVLLKIPAGTQSGQKFRIPNRGLPTQHKAHGNLFIIPQIVVPKHMKEEEQNLMKKWAELSTFNPRDF